jgi:hypothetical protein
MHTIFRLAIALAFTMSMSGYAVACSCIKNVSLSQQFSEATYVFVGRIVSTQETKSHADDPRRSGVAAKFQLIETIKGNPSLLPNVHSGYGGGDCGIPMLVGASYVFFADAHGEIDICSGTSSYIRGNAPYEKYLRAVKALAPKSSPSAH